MCEFMGEQSLGGRRIRDPGARTPVDIASERECRGAEGLALSDGLRVRMDAHVSELMAEARLHRTADLRLELIAFPSSSRQGPSRGRIHLESSGMTGGPNSGRR